MAIVTPYFPSGTPRHHYLSKPLSCQVLNHLRLSINYLVVIMGRRSLWVLALHLIILRERKNKKGLEQETRLYKTLLESTHFDRGVLAM